MAHWITKDIFEENDYRTSAEFTVMMYILLNRDMAAVCPVNERVVAARCRLKPSKVREILDYFEQKGKLIISDKRTHVWWKSGIFYSLNKGKFSPKQISSVSHLVLKWNSSGLFGTAWVSTLTQLYANKYKIAIPIPMGMDTISTETETESQLDSVSVSEQPEFSASLVKPKNSGKKKRTDDDDDMPTVRCGKVYFRGEYICPVEDFASGKVKIPKQKGTGDRCPNNATTDAKTKDN